MERGFLLKSCPDKFEDCIDAWISEKLSDLTLESLWDAFVSVCVRQKRKRHNNQRRAAIFWIGGGLIPTHNLQQSGLGFVQTTCYLAVSHGTKIPLVGHYSEPGFDPTIAAQALGPLPFQASQTWPTHVRRLQGRKACRGGRFGLQGHVGGHGPLGANVARPRRFWLNCFESDIQSWDNGIALVF